MSEFWISVSRIWRIRYYRRIPSGWWNLIHGTSCEIDRGRSPFSPAICRKNEVYRSRKHLFVVIFVFCFFLYRKLSPRGVLTNVNVVPLSVIVCVNDDKASKERWKLWSVILLESFFSPSFPPPRCIEPEIWRKIWKWKKKFLGTSFELKFFWFNTKMGWIWWIVKFFFDDKSNGIKFPFEKFFFEISRLKY